MLAFLKQKYKMNSSPKKTKVCIISSPGGHLFKTLQLKDWWEGYDRFWVTDSEVLEKTNLLNKEKVYQGFFPENRNLVNFLRNLALAWRLLRKEKPDFLFSIGAGIAPPFFFVGKLLGIKLIFMETFILTNHPTLSGRLIYPLSALFLVQNKKMLESYPKAKYLGSLL